MSSCTLILSYVQCRYKVKRFSLTGRTSEAKTLVEISLKKGYFKACLAVRIHDKEYLNHVEVLV